MQGQAGQDSVVRGLREQISDNDRLIVEAVNKRLRLVARLRDYKAPRGYEFVDQAREDWVTAYLLRANRGPLSSEGLRELYGALLELTKHEIVGETEGEQAS